MAKKAIKATAAGRVKAPQIEERKRIVFDKLGKVITWNIPEAPYKGEKSLRLAFVGGFEARVHQIEQNSAPGEHVAPERFNPGTTSQRAFEDGYHEAARQDGQHFKAAGLAGSKSAAKPVAKAARRAR